MDIKSKIRTVPDWPHKGIMFRDITSLLQDAAAFSYVCDQIIGHYKKGQFNKIVGIDARGFIFASILARHLGIGLSLVRKTGKLPYRTISKSYSLEYGESTLEIHTDTIKSGDKVLIMDDLLATGGTSSAAIDLVEKLGGEVIGLNFIIELPDLKGREKLKGYDIYSLINFEGL